MQPRHSSWRSGPHRSDSDGDYTFADEREEALRDAAVDFVDT